MQSIHVYIQIIINVECNIKGANLFTTHKVLHNILTVNSLHSFCIWISISMENFVKHQEIIFFMQ